MVNFLAIGHKNKMDIEKEMIIELEGLSQTILQHTNSNYIKSYAKMLLRLDYISDFDTVKLLVEKLYKWYDNEITIIKSSEFIMNKDNHLKSYELLKKWNNQIN